MEKDIKILGNELQKFNDFAEMNYKELLVDVDVKSNSVYNFKVSYLVDGAVWLPQYDANFSKKNKNMTLTYIGTIQQSTKEDWNDVKLSLSTAEPLFNKTIPQLSPWLLDTKGNDRIPRKSSLTYNATNEITYDINPELKPNSGALIGYISDLQTGDELIGATITVLGTNMGAQTNSKGQFRINNIPAGNHTIKVSYIGYKTFNIKTTIMEQKNANISIKLPSDDIQVNAVEIVAERKLVSPEEFKQQIKKRMDEVYSQINSNDLSTTFELPIRYTIPSDNNLHKVVIAKEEMPVIFEYISYPKLEPAVFQKAKIINIKDYPLIKGTICVYADNDFINKAEFNTLAPKDTVQLSLGIDSRIKIKKKLTNKFVETGGIFSKSNTLNLEYEIEIINNKDTEELIKIVDQIPISQNESITVTLLEPKTIFDKSNYNKELVWNLLLKPGEKKVIPIKLKIEHPDDAFIYGLDN